MLENRHRSAELMLFCAAKAVEICFRILTRTGFVRPHEYVLLALMAAVALPCVQSLLRTGEVFYPEMALCVEQR